MCLLGDTSAQTTLFLALKEKLDHRNHDGVERDLRIMEFMNGEERRRWKRRAVYSWGGQGLQ